MKRKPDDSAVADLVAKVEPAVRDVSITRLVAGAIGLVVLLLALGALAAAVRSQELDALDRFASPFMHDFASPPLDAVMLAATFLGSNTVLVPLAIATVGWTGFRGRPRTALIVAIAVVGSILLNGAMKVLVQRPRPKLPWSPVLPDYSFPSGHSMNSLVVFLTIAFVVWIVRGRRAGIVAGVVAVLLSLLIGISRVYLGAHYLTDVGGGYIAAVMWLLIVATAFDAGPRAYKWRRTRPERIRRQ